jgi:hypothetical protein
MQDLSTLQVLVTIILPALTAGAAWGGVKAALNGTRATVKRIETKIDAHHADVQARFIRVEDDVADVRERMVRVETKVG